MRILYTTKSYYPKIKGGGEKSLKLLVENISKHHSVEVISFDGNKTEHINKIKINRYDLKNKFLEAKKIFEYANGFDVLHMYNSYLYEYIGYLRPVIKVPIVVTLNNYPNLREIRNNDFIKNCRRRVYNSLYISGFKNFMHYVAISDSVKKEYIRLGFSKDKIKVIPNFIDSSFIKRKVHKKKKTVISYIGKLYRHKGVDLLLKAFAKINSKNMELHIYGNGVEETNLKNLAKELKIKPKFHGFIEEIEKAYDNADIVVHPGRWKEPFGRTIIEAMARSTPIVVSDIGAPPEIVGDKRLIFRNENRDDLANKLQNLIDNKKLRERLGKKLQKKSYKYTEEKIIKKFIDYYSTLS